MAGEKLIKAKEGTVEAVRRLRSDDVVSVVAYDHLVKTIVPATRAVDVGSIESRISSIHAGGSTALFGGVSQGAAEVRKNLGGRYVHRIILLSDGIANVGPSSPEDLGRLGAALLKEGISVTTVGVGTDYNEDLMARLSNNSDGNTYFVESSADLPRIFAAELGDVLSVVAKNVRVNIECPAGVKPLQIIGRDGRIRDRSVELSWNQLYGGQHKHVLLEVEVPSRPDGEALELAVAKATYENPVTRTVEISTGQASARFSADRDQIERSANVAVQRDYELNRNAQAQEQAISLADSGKAAEAAQVLDRSAEKLRSLGRRADDEALVKKAEDMERQAANIRRQGMTKKNRKELKTDSYQTIHQQRAR
jgi:Ca-activated chloride channel family protein